MTDLEKQTFIKEARDAISDMVKAYNVLELLDKNVTSQGGLAVIFSDDDFIDDNAGITADTMLNFFTGNLPIIESGLFSGGKGGNKTNTYGMARIARMK
jgi:hypothetical protein